MGLYHMGQNTLTPPRSLNLPAQRSSRLDTRKHKSQHPPAVPTSHELR